MLERSQLLELVAPNIDLLHNVLILTNFPDVSQDGRKLIFVELLFGSYVSGFNILLLYIRFLFRLVVVVKVFCSLIKSFEEIHHVPQPDIDFQVVNVFENLCAFDFAVDILSIFRPVEAVLFLVESDNFSDCFLLGPYVEQSTIIQLDDTHDYGRN